MISAFKVHLILEGNEEEAFFDIVKTFGVSEKIELTYENAGGSGYIAPKYQAAISSNYDFVGCVYDADYKFNIPCSAITILINQLLEVTGSYEESKKISFVSNPNILLWFLIGCDCYDNIKTIECSKKNNTSLLHKYWDQIGRTNKNAQNVSKEYKAHKWQLDVLKNSYMYEIYDYSQILKNAQEIPTDYTSNIASSNLLELLDALKNGNIDYFKYRIESENIDNE